jgi:16S rRNA (guanine1516-N2)-methyltransferase
MRAADHNEPPPHPAFTPLLVTTSHRADASLRCRAEQRARAWQIPFVPRDALPSLAQITSSGAALLVFSGSGLQLVDRAGTLTFHEGIAHLRTLHLAASGRDPLVHVGTLHPGDRVLDCTMGLAQDALVAARVVGPEGRVVAVESSLPLYAVVSEGLRAGGRAHDACLIEPVHSDHASFLRGLPSGSFDMVYFDPMFAAPRKAQAAFAAVRRHGNHTPLTRAVIAEACRVACRWVIVKCPKGSRVPHDLGMRQLPGAPASPFDWGRSAGHAAPGR